MDVEGQQELNHGLSGFSRQPQWGAYMATFWMTLRMCPVGTRSPPDRRNCTSPKLEGDEPRRCAWTSIFGAAAVSWSHANCFPWRSRRATPSVCTCGEPPRAISSSSSWWTRPTGMSGATARRRSTSPWTGNPSRSKAARSRLPGALRAVAPHNLLQRSNW
jgi:hypothetical protein